jgi:hypothetical protein
VAAPEVVEQATEQFDMEKRAREAVPFLLRRLRVNDLAA